MENKNQYKQDFLNGFCDLLRTYGTPHYEDLGIDHMELTEDAEYVRVYWDEYGDNYTTVCVACDSLGAMVYDIMKRIL